MWNFLQRALFQISVLGAVLMPVVAAAAPFQVRFVEPERFTDTRLGSHSGATSIVLDVIDRHLHGLADRCLGPAQALEIRVLDIDLAGSQEWFVRPGAHNLRVMREVTWPRIDISYSFRDGNEAVIEERERISDMNYLWNSASLRHDSMPLPYERAMLTNWFERKFCH